MGPTRFAKIDTEIAAEGKWSTLVDAASTPAFLQAQLLPAEDMLETGYPCMQVWMRPSAHSTTRKLYGIINTEIPAGEPLDL